MLLDQFDVEELFEKKCDCFGAVLPTSIALSGAAAVSANVALAGALVSGMGMMQQGQFQQSQANYQAGIAQNNAIIAGQQRDRAILEAKAREGDYTYEEAARMGKRFSLLGDTGTQRTTGSPLAVSSDYAGETQLNALRIRNQGAVEANRLEQEIMNQQAQAGLFQAQGQQARTSSYYKAGGELFAGGAGIMKAGKGQWGKTS